MEFLLIILQLAISALIIYWGCKVAQDNERNVPIAAVLSFLFGIFAVIGYYIAGKKNDGGTTKESSGNSNPC